MARVPQSKTELRSHLREQFEFLSRSCSEYDTGFTAEAKRIAATIRLMLHDTKNSHSLFSQLGLKSIGFLNTAIPIAKGEKQAILAFLQTRITVNEDLTLSGQHHPLLGHRPAGWPRAKKALFPDWWNQAVLTDMQGARFSRRMLVMAVANTDGGAHVDPEIDATYAALSRQNSIGYAVGVNDDIRPIDKVELACIRQIAYELTVSVLDRHPEFVPKL
ncbi:hypothetical protein JTL84_15450 [Pseudomonas aeruginosa]|uniref:Uncharacterized protein n=1 Tax=Pseudomonas aeruginosa TaxID=287 RepID=A0A7L9E9G5_PSEAI|nr:hypothetical protein [Pseudomonas aeruginosa]MBM9950457.1 hypothetical protein [Pseudomonas aeruginosa]QOJ62934.1 hypothetical protein [Pseudomonas aeruginosa]QOJ63487.1 hypothetical protein [Pseudomonas aeruginosa]QOJ66766.1 hypothetical protein [Pseudomonas aeruginosa]